MVSKIEADAFPIMWIALVSDRHTPMEMTDYADRYLTDPLKALPGVASVIIGGERKYSMRVWLDRERLAAQGLTAQDVEDALKRAEPRLARRAHREHATASSRCWREPTCERRSSSTT